MKIKRIKFTFFYVFLFCFARISLAKTSNIVCEVDNAIHHKVTVLCSNIYQTARIQQMITEVSNFLGDIRATNPLLMSKILDNGFELVSISSAGVIYKKTLTD